MDFLTMLAQNQPDMDAAAGVAIGIMLVVLVIVIAIMVVIYYLIYAAQSRVPEQYRDISPGQVFLMLIPLFNLVWMFFVFQRVPTSFQKYFAAQGRTDVGDCGKNIGMAYCICVLCSIIPLVGALAGLGSLVLLIIFLVKITGLKNQIPEGGGAMAAAPMPPAGGPPEQGPPVG